MRVTLPIARSLLRRGMQCCAGGVPLRPLAGCLVARRRVRGRLSTGEEGGAVRTRPRYKGGVEEEALMAAAVGGVERHHGSYSSRSWLQKEAVDADDNVSSAGSSSASLMSGRHGPRYMAGAEAARAHVAADCHSYPHHHCSHVLTSLATSRP